MSERLGKHPAIPQEHVVLRSNPTLPWARSRTHIERRSIVAPNEHAYLAKLDELIIALLASQKISFAELTRSCKGAWPRTIADRIAKLQLLHQLVPNQAAPPPPNYFPELHCGFGEWYFSQTTAKMLAADYFASGGFSIILGAPTVANVAAANGQDFVLVDNNPFIGLRFPALKERLFFSPVEYLNLHFAEPSVIFLDPPWYLPQILIWLAKASQVASRSSKIIMPFFPELTRPAAKHERDFVLSFARTIGEVTTVSNVVEYDSPLYEWEALTSHTIGVHPNWRRADLLIIEDVRQVAVPQEPEFNQESWENFLIGSQIIRLRLNPRSRRRGRLLSPIAGTTGFVFDTVSARDPRKPKIDLWSSRNRVASVGHFRRLRYVLAILAMNSRAKSHAEIRSRLSSLLTGPEIEALLKFLSWETSH